MKRRSDFVEWRRFETVRGNSKRIPQLMGRLATNEGPEEALTTLEDELFHQGWRPSAAKPAITALVDLLPATDLKAEVLYLLSCLAIGFDDHCLGPQGIEGSHYYDQELYSEAGRTFKDLVPFLESGSVEIRMGACLCLAWFPDLSEATLPLIRKMTSSSSESEVVVSLVTRGLLKDNVGLMRDGSKRMLYASNCAYCEAHPVGDENLEIFLDMCNWRYQSHLSGLGDFDNDPFGFSLGEYASSMLNRAEPRHIQFFLESAEASPFLTLVEGYD